MAEYVGIQTEQLVPFGQNVLLVDSIPCPKGQVVHRNGSGILTLRGCGSNCFSRFQVTFGANIAVPEGGMAGAIALALALNGEPILDSRAIVTPTAVEEYNSVSRTIAVTVPRGCCYTLAIENVNAGVDGLIDTQTISVADVNLTVARIA